MSEFRRLAENPQSELEGLLLAAGRQSVADDRMRAELLVALGISGTAAVGLSALTATLWKKAMTLGVVSSLGVGGAALVYQLASSDSGASEPIVVESVRVVQGAPREARPIVVAAAEQASVAPVVAPSLKPARGAMGKPEVGSIRDEVRTLDAARSALSAGDASGALTKLANYEAKFPKGTLRMEATLLRVRALAEAGRPEEASRQAKRLVSRNPNSVVASRLRRYILP